MEKVIVLMSTYNGEKYLRTQIDSLLSQDGVQVEILVRDDGSTDSTLRILESYVNTCDFADGNQNTNDVNSCSDLSYGSEKNLNKVWDKEPTGNQERKKGNISFYKGANVGPARSFLDLMKHAPEADFYALCDQDDTWLPDKLKIAVKAIQKAAQQNRNGIPKNHVTEHSGMTSHKDVPVLYYGMPRFADNDGNLLKGPKGIYEKSLDFSSCLIKSNSTGCTMVFNRRLRDIVNEKTPGDITMHDEWLHKVCLAVGGQLIYDEDVHMLYRQHGGNTIGGQLSLSKVMKRYMKTLFKPDCIRSRCIRSLIECYGDEMPEKNLKMAKKVACYKKSLKDELKLFFDRDIKTRYLKRNILFKAAVFLGIF